MSPPSPTQPEPAESPFERADAPEETRTRPRLRLPWELALVATIWLSLFPYSALLNNPNERTRVLQARALVERGSLAIGDTFRDRRGLLLVRDPYGNISPYPFVNDLALVCTDPTQSPPDCEGKLYPAKAPGAALLGVPALALARAAGLVPDGPRGEAAATWVLRYGGVALPMLLALAALSSLLGRAGLPPPLRRRVVLAAGLGTTLFPYAISFTGHATASGALLGGVFLLERARRQRGARGLAWASLGGHVTAWAVLFEYHAAIAVAVVGAWVLLSRDRGRLVPGFALGALGALAIHFAAHEAMFGSPLKTGHFFLLSAHNRAGQAHGFMGIDGLHAWALHGNLFDPYVGLVPLMPWLAVGFLAGAPSLLRRGAGTLPVGLGRTLVAIPLVYLLFVSTLGNWRVMNGWSIGPRYLVPALLPTAFVAGVGWLRLTRWPLASRALAGLAAASVVVVWAITATFPSPPPTARNPFAELALPLLSQGYGVRNVLQGVGGVGLWFLGALAAVAAAWIALGPPGSPPEAPTQAPAPPRPLGPWARGSLPAAAARLAALAVAVLWLGVWARVRPSAPAARAQAQAYCKQFGEGIRPNGPPHPFW